MRRTLLAASCTALFSASPVLAQSQDTLKQAEALIAAGSTGQALQLLSAEEDRNAGNPDFDYLLGLAALDAGQVTRAIFAFERVLAVRPGHAQARAELARALAASGENEAAKAALEDVKRANPPQEVQERIDRLLGAIERSSRRTSVTGWLEAGIGLDSNVNSATSSSTIAVPAFGGAVFTLGAAGVKQRDEFASFAGAMDVSHAFTPEWSAFGRLSGSLKRNKDQDTFDTHSADLTAGIAYTSGKNRFSLAGQAGTFGVDNSRFRDYLGVTGQWRYSLSQNAEAGLFVQRGRLDYPGQDIRNAHRTVVGATFVHLFGGRWQPALYGSVYAGEERERAANVPHLGHKLYGTRVGGEAAWNERTKVFASASYEDRDYGGAEPLFLTTRGDRQLDLAAGVRYAIGRQWEVTPQVSYTDNRSNIGIFRYERTQALVTLRYRFD